MSKPNATPRAMAARVKAEVLWSNRKSCNHKECLGKDEGVLAITEGVLAITEEVLAITEEVLAITEEVLAITEEVLAITEEVLAITEEVLAPSRAHAVGCRRPRLPRPAPTAQTAK
jgi:hypothetical protein